MTSRALRWIAVPLAFGGGLACATWVFLWAGLACLHLGPRPANLCSDWWYASHDFVAVAGFVACSLACSVAAPVLLAPSHKRLVALVAFLGILGFIIADSDCWLAFNFVVAALAIGVIGGLTWRRYHAA
jgi:hypothetical protein